MVKYKKSISGRIFDVINHLFMLIFAISCMYPFYYILIYSFSDPEEVDKVILWLYPIKPTLLNYEKILATNDIFSAVFISVSRTVLGTIIAVLCCSFMAYLFMQKEMPCRKLIYRYFILTMYVGGGLIPYYMTMKMIHFINNFLLYIIPGAVSVFFIMLIKAYMEQLPVSLEESAKIEGAGYMTIFLKVIFPLSRPILATCAIFAAVGQWNAWTDNLFFCLTPKLTTLQYLLYTYMTTALAMNVVNASELNEITRHRSNITPMSVRMTMTAITVFPILVVYPLMQKQFIKGIMIGAIKG